MKKTKFFKEEKFKVQDRYQLQGRKISYSNETMINVQSRYHLQCRIVGQQPATLLKLTLPQESARYLEHKVQNTFFPSKPLSSLLDFKVMPYELNNFIVTNCYYLLKHIGKFKVKIEDQFRDIQNMQDGALTVNYTNCYSSQN